MTNGRCRSCRAEIIWVFTEAGRRMPIDPTPTDDGNLRLSTSESGQRTVVVVEPGSEPGLYLSHFVACPAAEKHRRR